MSGAAGIPTITAGRRSTTPSGSTSPPEVLAWIESFLD